MLIRSELVGRRCLAMPVTHRGQIRDFLGVVVQRKDKDKVKVVAILSNWYSGATLLALLLNRYPEIICNGETFPFSVEDKRNYYCSCGLSVYHCNFYNYAGRHMRAGSQWNRYLFSQLPQFSRIRSLDRAFRSPRWESKTRRAIVQASPSISKKMDIFLDAHVQFFINALSFSGAKIYADGTKSIRRAQILALDSRVDFRVIHLVRGPMAFVNSYRKNKNLSRINISYATHLWRDHIVEVDRFANQFPHVPSSVVRYEDICKLPGETLKKTLSCLEVSSDQEMGRKTISHVLGNRMRRQFDGVIKEDVSWRSELSLSEMRLIREEAKIGMKRFKYEP